MDCRNRLYRTVGPTSHHVSGNTSATPSKSNLVCLQHFTRKLTARQRELMLLWNNTYTLISHTYRTTGWTIYSWQNLQVIIWYQKPPLCHPSLQTLDTTPVVTLNWISVQIIPKSNRHKQQSSGYNTSTIWCKQKCDMHRPDSKIMQTDTVYLHLLFSLATWSGLMDGIGIQNDQAGSLRTSTMDLIVSYEPLAHTHTSSTYLQQSGNIECSQSPYCKPLHRIHFQDRLCHHRFPL